jgi:hypothetical protein
MNDHDITQAWRAYLVELERELTLRRFARITLYAVLTAAALIEAYVLLH